MKEKRLVNDKLLAQTVSFETNESPHTDTDIMYEGHEGGVLIPFPNKFFF